MSNQTECPFEQHLIFDPIVQFIFSVIYLNIAIFGVTGNILMIISTLKSRLLWVNTRMYLINMAVSDIIMCLTSVPVTPYTAFTGKWIFGEIFCHLLPMVQGATVYISSLSLLGIAWDRYTALDVRKGRRSEISAAFLIMMIDIMSLVLMTPYSLNMEWLEDGEGQTCSEEWRGSWRKVFGVMTLLLQFCVPLTVSLIVFVKILRTFDKQEKSYLAATRSLARRKSAVTSNRYRSLILLSMLVVFTVCWLPINIINLLEDFEVAVLCWPGYYFLFFTLHVLAMLSTCCNPLLYGWLMPRS